ncbi:sensor histidine kinase [Richelia sinica]|uniref:sensor histidine kinase n=1 Tax=Richelia sinica TaxID=1357545 RepID=UPI00168529C4|nr:HAMP domain-containing sensor histidine kinase [Richelia sinica]MBD2666626.1 HAMP domain-containing histidine kinase [Richelia sinica FACHB-800]
MYEWILPSLREVLTGSQPSITECSSAQAEQQWRVSLAATENLLLKTLATTSSETTHGLVITAPAPLFSQPQLTQSLQTVTFTAKPFNPLALMPFQIPVAIEEEITPQESILPLLPADPLGMEQFCLVFTERFRLVLVLAERSNGQKEFAFSFEPDVVQQAWRAIGARIILNNPELFADLDVLVQDYAPATLDYHSIIHFTRCILQEVGEPEADKVASPSPISTSPHPPITPPAKPSPRPDVELLQAFAHEVRTPLTTIRTMTRLLLKRRDLPDTVINRLEIIDHECTEQIDRMELLFKAAELETTATTKPVNTQLTPTSLDQVLQQSIPRWQQAANRRNLTIDVVLPQQLPMVVSNPAMLDRVLTGLMENFTRSLPPGSCIQVQVIPAGDQLKLQLSPQIDCQNNNQTINPPIRKSLGQLLMFQPETGTISLNMAATKHLFQAIGGKLIVRQRHQNEEVLTIFLPLEISGKQKVGVK